MERTITFVNRRGWRLVADVLRPQGASLAPMVVFAHGWGSDRRSRRNRAIAEQLVEAGIGACLLDFSGHGDSEGSLDDTTPDQQVEDLLDAVDHVAAEAGTGAIGVAGSSSGAAVALAAAAQDARIAALVLRAPSAAARHSDARRVHVPTLVIQGDGDPLLARNRILAQELAGESQLRVVAGATHLFDEPGTLAIAGAATLQWFRRCLVDERQAAGAPPQAARAEAPARVPARFRDRRAAGEALASRLRDLERAHPVVVALPRGGIDVAEPIACALRAELDVFVSRKLRLPFQPEVAMGALAERDVVVWNEDVIAGAGIDEKERTAEVERVRRELEELVAEVRAVLPRVPLGGRTVVIVDDGVATGATLQAAIRAIVSERPARLVVALPGGAPDSLEEIADMKGVDEVVALARPEPFRAVGQLYDRFDQVSSEHVCDVLRRRRSAHAREAPAAAAAT